MRSMQVPFRPSWPLTTPAQYLATLAHSAEPAGSSWPRRNQMRSATHRPGESSAPVFRDGEQGRLLIGTPRLAVKFKSNVSEQDAKRRLAEARVTVLRELSFAKNLYQVEVAAGEDAIDVSVALQNDDAVEYAEPELIEHLPTRLRPSDPQYARQWQWNNDGSVGGTNKADVRAELAWDSGRGSGIRVAVIDNGFDIDHPDLASAIDPATAYFLRKPNGDAELKRTAAGFPDSNHGTFCAGMVGARADNAAGGCGAAPEASLDPDCVPERPGRHSGDTCSGCRLRGEPGSGTAGRRHDRR